MSQYKMFIALKSKTTLPIMALSTSGIIQITGWTRHFDLISALCITFIISM